MYLAAVKDHLFSMAQFSFDFAYVFFFFFLLLSSVKLSAIEIKKSGGLIFLSLK